MLKHLYTFIQNKRKLSPYFYIFFFVIIFTYFLSIYIGFNTTDIDSAKSLISTIIQSEAAILAIVVTLSLVAVQQTASSYSPRVIEVFKNVDSNPDFYLLMVVYLVSIIYEMWVLKQINNDNFGNILNFEHSFFNSFEAHVWISYALGAFSLLSLVPYIRNTLDLLKPSTIMVFLSENIKKNNILSSAPRYPASYFNLYNPYLNSYESNEHDRDPVLPIVDIINNSLMKYDYAISIDGLLIIRKASINILDSSNIKDDEFKIIYKMFAKHFLSIGKLAICKGDETCADLVMSWFYQIIIILVRKEKDFEAMCTLDPICEIGQTAIKQKNKRVVVASYRYIQDIFERSSEKNMRLLLRGVTRSLIEISELSAEYKIKGIYSEIIDPLFLIVKRTFIGKYIEEFYLDESDGEFDDEFYDESENGSDEEIEDEHKEYYEIIDETPEDLVMLILKGMCRVGQLLYEKKMFDDINCIIKFVEYIEKNAREHGREDILKPANSFLSKYKILDIE